MNRIEGPDLDRADVCEPILRALPEWFGIEEALVEYGRAIDRMPTFLARSAGDVVGFLSINRHNDYSAEMHVLGILKQHHRRGLGSQLVRRAESWLINEGAEYLQVKTVGPSSDDAAYARTRKFYEAMGFRPLEEIPTLWSERNPCLIMVKRLGMPRATDASTDP